MILYKKIRLKPDGTGPAIGVVMSDGKGKAAFSMAKNAKKMFDQDTGAKIFSTCCMFQDVDEFNEFEGIGRCMKKLFANHDDIKDIQTRFTKRVCKTNLIGINKIPTFPLFSHSSTKTIKNVWKYKNNKCWNISISRVFENV